MLETTVGSIRPSRSFIAGMGAHDDSDSAGPLAPALSADTVVRVAPNGALADRLCERGPAVNPASAC
jgi:hypothetical protein